MTDYADLEKRLREDAAGYETTSEVLSGEEHSAIAHRLARMSKQRAKTATEAADALSSLRREREEAREAVLPLVRYLREDQYVEPDGPQEIWLDENAVPALLALYALANRLSSDLRDENGSKG